MFGQLCDDGAAKNVTLATTKWSKALGDEGLRHERQLSEKYWINMLGKGSHIAPFMDTHESAWHIVDLIIKNEPFDAILFQKLVHKKELPESQPRSRGFFRFFRRLFEVSASHTFIVFASLNWSQ